MRGRAAIRFRWQPCAALVVAAALRPSPCGAWVDPADSAHPPLRRYASAEGLPNDTINSIRLDARGYLWISTQSGAARFDGRVFTVVDMPDATQNYVRDVLPLPDGTIWFARQSGGVVRLSDGVMTNFETVAGEPFGRVNALYARTEGDAGPAIYAARHNGAIARFAGGAWTKLAGPDAGFRAWKFLETTALGGKPRLLAATEAGLFAIDEGRSAKVDLPADAPTAPFNSLAESREGEEPSLWIGTYGAGVLRLHGGRLTRYDAATGLGSNLVTCLAATRGSDGTTVWVSTRGGGLARIDGDRVRPVPLDGRSQEIYSLLAPPGYDSVWVGTRGNGLLQIRRGPWSTLDVTSGLVGESISSITEMPGAEGPQVNLGSTRGLLFFSGERWNVLDPSKGLPAYEVPALARSEDALGPSLWIATLANGLARLRGGRIELFDAAHGFPTDRLNSLYSDGDGVWVGSDTGSVYRVDSRTGRVEKTVSGLPRAEVLRMAKGEDGTLFCATRAGLAVVVPGRPPLLFRQKDGLPNDEVLTVAVVGRSPGAEVWAGTRGGVAVAPLPLASPARFTPLSPVTEGLAGVATMAIVPSPDGRVWLGTQRGIVRLTRKPEGRFDARLFTTADGLPSNLCSTGGLVDGSGRTWIATIAGVAIFDPRREETTPPPAKPLVLERLLVNGEARPPVPGARFSYRESTLSFELSLLSYAGDAARYRTQLVGLESAPGPFTNDAVVNLRHVPPGKYVLRAWARDHTGVESGPVEFPFVVLPPPWRTAPAYALYVLLFAGAIVGGVRIHSAQLRRHNQELAAIVEEKTRELRAARDQALAGSQTKSAFLANVSHELRTPLNAILGYAELLAEELATLAPDAIADLEKIQKAARHQLGLVNEVLDLSKIEAGRFELHITRFSARTLVDEVAATARPLVTRGGNVFSVEVETDMDTLSADEVRLKQVLLNLLSNAAKFTRQGRVTLEVKHENGDFAFVVKDTGTGMNDEQKSRLFQPFMQADASTSALYGGTGLGLVIAKRFCELMGGDLTAESEPGRGSTFTARVPADVQ